MRGPGQAQPRQLPLHHTARQGHTQTQARSCACYGTLVLPPCKQHEKPGWLTLQTCVRLCWELSSCPTTHKGPGPPQGPVLTSHCCQDLL